MVYVYIGENVDKKTFLDDVLLRHIAAPFEILTGQNGKPYVRDNPVFFNLSHSGKYCAVAVGRSPAGIDVEAYGRGVREAVLHSFPQAEQAEIRGEEDFLSHWTARESYIKYCGGTLAQMLKSLSYTGGRLYCGGVAVSPVPSVTVTENFVLSLCSEDSDATFVYCNNL